MADYSAMLFFNSTHRFVYKKWAFVDNKRILLK